MSTRRDGDESADLEGREDTAAGDPVTGLGEPIETVDSIQPPAPAGSRFCLVEIHGPDRERRIDLTGDRYELGRADTNDIPIRAPSASRNHARLLRAEGGFELVDLESTNGTYVNELRVERCPLRHGDTLALGNTIFRFLATPAIDDAVAELVSRLPYTDGLTQVANRTALEAMLAERAGAGRPQCLILLRIDAYAEFERQHGVLAIERIVTLVAGMIRLKVRKTDLVARATETTFAILLDTDEEGAARRKAESLRRHVAQSSFRYRDTPLPVALTAHTLPVPAGPGAAALEALTRALDALAGPALATGPKGP